eukprot:TRINITY_DN13012_c0_g1_i1.p1 TRINITY_DN13012_c0_g1~~TRINITY_DN13012_c0_g1_i1.p1  ORF type:complete len:225 (+),score=44.40 TRINITY_DN13012_c0_g1_i1:3-677(+)
MKYTFLFYITFSFILLGNTSLVYNTSSYISAHVSLSLENFNTTDSFGCSVSVYEDLDGDGIPEILVGDKSYQSNQGAVFLIYLNMDFTVKKAYCILSGRDIHMESDRFGSSIAFLKLNNERPILLIGAEEYDNVTSGKAQGALYLIEIDDQGRVVRSEVVLGSQVDAQVGGFFGRSVVVIDNTAGGNDFFTIGVGASGSDTVYVLSIDDDLKFKWKFWILSIYY